MRGLLCAATKRAVIASCLSAGKYELLSPAPLS